MIIEVPHTWTEMDCRTPLSPACLPPQGIRVGHHTVIIINIFVHNQFVYVHVCTSNDWVNQTIKG